MGLVMLPGWSTAASRGRSQETFWTGLAVQAEELGLPTEFLSGIDSTMVTIEFEDLRSYAAEYHLEDQRVVLNRSLSLNGAGRVLRPLATLTSHEVATLYHELFHAYMDLLSRREVIEALSAGETKLIKLANTLQVCRYSYVLITPMRQRKVLREERFLTQQESWEALNETWAVFVEWVIWTKLEMMDPFGQPPGHDFVWHDVYKRRFLDGDQSGQWVGFYEPQAPEERMLTNKRYLASSHRITPEEVSILLSVVLQEPPNMVDQLVALMIPEKLPKHFNYLCKDRR